jgi:hypothetical protein
MVPALWWLSAAYWVHNLYVVAKTGRKYHGIAPRVGRCTEKRHHCNGEYQAQWRISDAMANIGRNGEYQELP